MNREDQNDISQWLDKLTDMDDTSKMTPKQLRIVQAAVEIIAEKGFAAASTSEIAQRAGVAEGTIFRHYKTKKDLLVSIVSPIIGRLVSPFVLNNFKEVLVTDYPTFEDFLRAMLRNRIKFAKDHLKVIKILLQEIPFQPALKNAFIEQVGRKVMERMIGIITHFQEKGEIIKIPPPDVARFAASSVLGLLATHLLLLPDLPWDEERAIEQTIQLLLHGLSGRE